MKSYLFGEGESWPDTKRIIPDTRLEELILDQK